MKIRQNKLNLTIGAVLAMVVFSFAFANIGHASILRSSYGLPEGSIWSIINGMLNWLLGTFAVIGIIGFLISGIMYIISSGDEGMADRAKNGMKYSIIGILVGLSGYVIIQAIERILDAVSF